MTPAPDLGPTTEARFADAFAERAVIGRKDAAHLLGVDPKAFDALALPSVVKGQGRARGYTEHHLRAYLAAQLTEAPRAKPSPPRPPSGRVLRFTERHKV